MPGKLKMPEWAKKRKISYSVYKVFCQHYFKSIDIWIETDRLHASYLLNIMLPAPNKKIYRKWFGLRFDQETYNKANNRRMDTVHKKIRLFRKQEIKFDNNGYTWWATHLNIPVKEGDNPIIDYYKTLIK